MSEVRISSPWPNPVRSPNYQELYCNISQTIMTPWDISLHVGFMGSPKDGQPSVQEMALITFSPQQFKALAAAFGNAIAAYETRFGAVTVNLDLVQSPDALRKALDEADQRAGIVQTKP
jgi:hypothetical protein